MCSGSIRLSKPKILCLAFKDSAKIASHIGPTHTIFDCALAVPLHPAIPARHIHGTKQLLYVAREAETYPPALQDAHGRAGAG